jgi:release factor glutamine methyltransferase
MTINQASKDLAKELLSIYDDRESAAITDWVMEYLTGWKRLERIINKNEVMSDHTIEQLNEIMLQLKAHKPVQYILHQAWFHKMRLFVDEHVLIPRPETEELLQWAIAEADNLQRKVGGRRLRALDVGTGSGCIAIALKKERPELEVHACDISKGALEVAKKNALLEDTKIEFYEMDFLDDPDRESLPLFDLIISNPPYIAEQDKSSIDKHVVEYEPHLALFVPQEDSLIFYRQLVEFGKTHLQGGGCMLMEIHFAKGLAVTQLFNEHGYHTELKRDMQGNDRMVAARRR